MTYNEIGIAEAIGRLSGATFAELSQDERDLIDQFHAGGPEAVDRTLAALGAAPGQTVLDVGSGLGGPARQLAQSTGCDVLGVDVTAEYVRAARELTSLAGLADRVRFVCTDLAALDEDGFAGAYTMHVQMNVPDKKAFYSEIARRLRPEGHLGVFEVCRAGTSEATPPLPWSLDGSDSHLVIPDELRTSIEAAGFTTLDWVDETEWTLEWFDRTAARLSSARPRASLAALLHDGPIRMMNFLAAIRSGAVSIHRGAFALAPGRG
ncbi:MAG TPA: methyltransferase domain-containing protein [Jatrophihabitantaceae bacterium]|jgi:cyclopropane fatty-acyl-phospholipid synthase-like methyltransferase|nr:methyltransferase domain-containing protein [Jatrophihabitantaceae bacterium]